MRALRGGVAGTSWRRTLLVVLGLGAWWAAEAHAWGRTGHRITGAIAEAHLTPAAAAAVRTILGPETLAEASTWADEMRSSPERFWQEEAGAYHYVTVPPGKTYAEVGPPPRGDAMTALVRFTATLGDDAAGLADRQLALRFLVHVIGDLHQPLHVGNGRDRGGNDFEVRFFGEPTNLHRLWDSQMIDSERLSFSEWAGWLDAKIDPAEVAVWADDPPRVWIAESAAIRGGIYPEERSLGWDYKFVHLPTVEARLSRAGIRIAGYLNALFSPSP